MIHRWKWGLLEGFLRWSGVGLVAGRRLTGSGDGIPHLEVRLAVANFFGVKTEALGWEVRLFFDRANHPGLFIGQQCMRRLPIHPTTTSRKEKSH